MGKGIKRKLVALLVPMGMALPGCERDLPVFRDYFEEAAVQLTGEIVTDVVEELINPSVRRINVRPETLSSGLEAIIIDNCNLSGISIQEDRPQTRIVNDGNNRPFIIYSNGADGHLSFARHDGSGWIGGAISDKAGASYCSLVLDESDSPHILSTGDGGGAGEDLLYFTTGFGGWVSEVVDNAASVGLENDIAIDSKGFVHASHWSWAEDALKYSTNKTGRWVNEELGPAGWSQTSVLLDKEDNVHIAFGYYGSETFYMNNASGNWGKNEIPDSGHDAAMQMDSNGLFHVTSSNTSGLYHSVGRDDSWTTERIIDNNGPYVIGYTPRMVLGQYDSPIIAYIGSDESYFARQGKLYVARRGDDGWQRFVLDDKLGYLNPDISVDGNGDVHISTMFSADEKKGVLKYIRFSLPD